MLIVRILECAICGYKLVIPSAITEDEDKFFSVAFKAAHIAGDHGQIQWPRLMKARKLSHISIEGHIAKSQPRSIAKVLDTTPCFTIP